MQHTPIVTEEKLDLEETIDEEITNKKQPNMVKLWWEASRFWIAFFVGIAVVICGCLSFAIWIIHLFGPYPDSSSLGDSFGALNTLFSGFAFLALIMTLYSLNFQIKIQREDIELQKRELELTREELSRTADAQEEAKTIMEEQAELNRISMQMNYLGNMLTYCSAPVGVGLFSDLI